MSGNLLNKPEYITRTVSPNKCIAVAIICRQGGQRSLANYLPFRSSRPPLVPVVQ